MNERWQRGSSWVEVIIRVMILLIASWMVWWLLWTTEGTRRVWRHHGKVKGWVLEPLKLDSRA